MRLLPLVLILAGCATAQAGGPTLEREALDRELAARAAGPGENCISAMPSSASLTIVDSQTLTYRQGRTIWVNRLRDECPGLRPHDTLIVEMLSGSQYCRNDRFRTIEPGSSIPGPTCVLGDFIPYRTR
jgi:hypothetical protein